ncbi:hypothetical protein MMC17_007063 [Xylographa soralifera]|nr:hypothetical protein [Xylographa soralifera]
MASSLVTSSASSETPLEKAETQLAIIKQNLPQLQQFRQTLEDETRIKLGLNIDRWTAHHLCQELYRKVEYLEQNNEYLGSLKGALEFDKSQLTHDVERLIRKTQAIRIRIDNFKGNEKLSEKEKSIEDFKIVLAMALEDPVLQQIIRSSFDDCELNQEPLNELSQRIDEVETQLQSIVHIVGAQASFAAQEHVDQHIRVFRSKIDTKLHELETAENAVLNDLRQMVNDKIKEIDQRLPDIEGTIAVCDESIEKQRQIHDQSLQVLIDKQKQALNELEGKLKQKDDDANTLRQQHEIQLNSNIERIKDIENQFSEAQVTIKNQEITIDELKTSVRSLQESLQRKDDEMQISIDKEVQIQTANLRNRITNLDTQLNESATAISSKHEEISAMRIEKRGLTEELNKQTLNASKNLETIRDDLQQSRQQYTSTKDDLEAMSTRYNLLEKSRNEEATNAANFQDQRRRTVQRSLATMLRMLGLFMANPVTKATVDEYIAIENVLSSPIDQASAYLPDILKTTSLEPLARLTTPITWYGFRTDTIASHWILYQVGVPGNAKPLRDLLRNTIDWQEAVPWLQSTCSQLLSSQNPFDPREISMGLYHLAVLCSIAVHRSQHKLRDYCHGLWANTSDSAVATHSALLFALREHCIHILQSTSSHFWTIKLIEHDNANVLNAFNSSLEENITLIWDNTAKILCIVQDVGQPEELVTIAQESDIDQVFWTQQGAISLILKSYTEERETLQHFTLQQVLINTYLPVLAFVEQIDENLHQFENLGSSIAND